MAHKEFTRNQVDDMISTAIREAYWYGIETYTDSDGVSFYETTNSVNDNHNARGIRDLGNQNDLLSRYVHALIADNS